MINEMLDLYLEPTKEDIYHRYNSWHHCRGYFATHHKRLQEESIQEVAALQLGFYLAGCEVRSNSGLFHKDYKIHLKFISTVANKADYEAFHSGQLPKEDQVGLLIDLINETQECYGEFGVSDMLVTKILLGVFGIIPAYDDYFKNGLKLHSMESTLTEESLKELILFYKAYEVEFNPYLDSGYTPMKLVDMYFRQVTKYNKHASKIIQSGLESSDCENSKMPNNQTMEKEVRV
ncbi:hypothetical protein [Sporosarcina highlanderae]|uniref:Uncharacterized protein n=1 Tax=Sporosarcina highlanderae TaxID=3035916 RepID=A0ABT8JSP4_9BACL|nr:hypothetical protein [Sporosarcina highlanderae]MDN4608104.1 hypothetical protein [Sporosarcina highlanderae]